ncbi:hypothetical protein [Paenibacillus tuaregi]|uniref:hypothetical protein n=1 Tax=Paenibacillus tuaregi TaxID=1816681 RepID=UPI0009EE2F31|nr:hypothetical protein [Paenibacillus tuaregi]
MSRWSMLVTVLSLTVCTALIVSAFSAPGYQPGNPSSRSVFGHQQVVELRQDNLVDELAGLPLSVRISKADLDGAILSVELKIQEEGFYPSVLYLNMAELIRFSFEGTSNVNQLLVRLVAEDKWIGSKHLLLASDVRRGEWPSFALNDLENLGNQPLTDQLKEYFRFTVTNLWKTRFEPDLERQGL